MGKKFVKTTFAILSFMMLLPTSVFAEDASRCFLLLYAMQFDVGLDESGKFQ